MHHWLLGDLFLCHVYVTVQMAMFALYTDEIGLPFWSSLFSHLHNCEWFNRVN